MIFTKNYINRYKKYWYNTVDTCKYNLMYSNLYMYSIFGVSMYLIVEDVSSSRRLDDPSLRCFGSSARRKKPELWTCFRSLRVAFGLLGHGFHSALSWRGH